MSAFKNRIAATAIASFAFLGIASVSDAQAEVITWDFAGGCTVQCGTIGTYGNTRTFLGSDGSTTVTVAAYGLTGSSNTVFQTAFLGHYTNGLGSTNRGEGIGISSNSHTVDNNSQLDVVAFYFSDTITITGAMLSAYADTDITVWIGTVGAMPDLTSVDLNNFTKLTAEFDSFHNNGGSSNRTADFGAFAEEGNFLLIAARIDQTNDRFKIAAVSAFRDDPPSSDIPEPASLAVLGLGVLGLAGLRRRRTAA